MLSKNSLLTKSLLLLSLVFSMSCTKTKKQKEGVQNLNSNAKKGGSITYILTAEPKSLNPVSSSDLYASAINANIFEYLLTRNLDTNEYESALAEEWSISDDGLTFTFKLREGVKWSDGKPLTVDDVEFSFKALFDNKYPILARIRPYVETIKNFEKIDERSFKFTASEVYFKNFDAAAYGYWDILPKHIYGDPVKAKKEKRIIGTGPYILDRHEKGKKVVLKRNPNWWGAGLERFSKENNFDRIIYKFSSEPSIAREMLKKGDVDMKELNTEEFMVHTTGPDWKKNVTKVKTTMKRPLPYRYVGFNMKNPIFQDVKVRRGITHLMNRELMVKKFLHNMAMPLAGPWYMQSPYANPNTKALAYNPKKGLELLRSAGWKDSDGDGILDKVINGKKTKLSFSIDMSNPQYVKYFEIFKEDAKQVGVEIKVNPIEWNALIKLIEERKFDAISLGWGGGTVDNDPKQIWHSDSARDGGSNHISYSNKKVDNLIDEARKTLDKDKRIKLLQEVYQLISDDAPYIFMFNDKYFFYAHSDKVAKPKDSFNYGFGTNFWWSVK